MRSNRPFSYLKFLSVISKKSEDFKEQTNNINVEVHDSKHVVVDGEANGVLSEDQLGVHDDVDAVDHGEDDAEHSVHELAVEEQEGNYEEKEEPACEIK